MKNPVEMTNEEVLREAHAIRVGYGAKRTLRYASERDFSVHSESVAEHEWALHFLAHYFLSLEDPTGRLIVTLQKI